MSDDTPSGTATHAEAADVADGDLPSVCVVTHPLASAGENATRSLLDILGALTSVVLVTANLPEDSEIHDNWPVIELTRKGTGQSVLVAAIRFLRNQIRMARVIRKRKEPVVLFFGATSYLLPIIVARLAGKTVLIQPRGNVPLTLRLSWEQRMPDILARGLAGIVWLLERLGLVLADGVITYTPGMAASLDIDPAGETVYPTGARYVRTDEFTVETPYDERENVVGYLGRLDEEKGIRQLATVAQNLPDDIRFRFVGDGDLRGWLEDELAAEIANGTVAVTGWVDHDDVPSQLADFRLLVLPSEPTEGLPTTILESLACGTPVYASPVSGVPDVVQDRRTGFHIDAREPAALQQGIEEILPRDDLQEISKRGRALIEHEYSFDAATERYRAILRTV